MADIELDLLENSIDSLNEALDKYAQGKDGDAKAYKFCVQHLSHFFELLLKYYVTRSHPMLIYKNPYAKIIDSESQTIGLHEAINFLKNEGQKISDKFEKDLKWLKSLRNNIEHHKFSMNLEEVEETIGRLISAVVEFDESHESIDISSYIDAKQYEVFRDLAYTYEQRLAKAMEAVEAAEAKAHEGYRPKEYMLVDFRAYHCNECDHDTIVPNGDSSTGYRCTFCGAVDSDDIEVGCGVCGDSWTKDMMEYTTWADDGRYIYVCPRCRRDPQFVNDD